MKLWKLAVATVSIGLSTGANAAIVHLDFVTYATYSCGNSCINFYENPIISNYRISLDSSTLANTAYTDAYNNNTNYTETVSTSLSDSANPVTNWNEYSASYLNLNQTYQHFGSSDSVMSRETSFNNDYATSSIIDNIYTGNLPPELAPDSNSSAVTFENGTTHLSLGESLGSSPSFVIYNEANLVGFFDTLIGNEFQYYKNKYSYTCQEVDQWGNCTNQLPGYVSTTIGGTAVLSTVTVVPVPAAVWLFGSGLIGLVGFARRKKA